MNEVIYPSEMKIVQHAPLKKATAEVSDWNPGLNQMSVCSAFFHRWFSVHSLVRGSEMWSRVAVSQESLYFQVHW